MTSYFSWWRLYIIRMSWSSWDEGKKGWLVREEETTGGGTAGRASGAAQALTRRGPRKIMEGFIGF